ncbi:putative bifunctional diguanylate cyclase/phosphodiesterase [Pseudoalteromonas agarivorans]|uniref:putative bifunctional diguanylate cyclase/phosphodiesterase n=1 Tax=Pseudoalteromonas agarivorans TaxID=176102 RepID=UPI00249C5AAB|nr:bifunctional diguanylate cyclase/phosphodiesterase [Pseudoalteromonas agarivorans]MDI3243779.1 bifunctional diguanylate cyclase/phosphodiesterase [Pseudoalteromonas agarivorans]
MRFNVSRSASSILYSAILYFHCIIFALGMAESTFLGYELMEVISPTVAVNSLIIAAVLLIMKKIDLSTKKFCTAIASASALCLLFVQFSFLFHMQINYDLWSIDDSPFTLSLSAIFTFTILSAFTIKAFHGNVKARKNNSLNFIILIIVLTGSVVWHQVSLKLVKSQDASAREKVHLVGSMLNNSLLTQKKALARLKSRVEKVNFEDFRRLIRIDAMNYKADYDVIKGVLVLDDKLQHIATDSFSTNFFTEGMINKPTIRSWIKGDSEEVRFAANSLSLDSDTPILMFLARVTLADQNRYYVLNLLDMNLLIEKNYLKYLGQFDAFLELTPGTYFSVDYKNKTQVELSELTSRYNSFIMEKINVMDLVEHKVYNFLSDYKAIHVSTIINQSILWLTFLFAFIFTLVADSSRILEFNAKHDELTGFLRLKTLKDKFSEYCSIKKCNNFAVVIIKIDFFDEIQNSLGYEISDQITKQTAEKIKANSGNQVLISKGFNDSFVLYYINTSEVFLTHKVEAILLELSKFYCIDKFELNLTSSAGVVYYDSPKSFNFKLNLQQANIALERSMELGGNQIQIYKQSMDDKFNEKTTIRNKLDSALKNNELQVFYQPIHNLSGNQVVAVEALVRWPHQDGWISPAKFIPIAETTGQIVQVGKYVLNQVIRDIGHYPELQKISVAVNFSTKQLIKENFAIDLQYQLTQNNIDYRKFTIEVTESAFQEKTTIEKTLTQLIASGLNVAIDDFGTGFSSLSYLANQPANIIKIDREFTLGADKNTKEQKLLDTIITICYDLGKKVVVEGVEDEKLINHLSRYKDIRIQGYFFSKPLPVDQVAEYIRATISK